ncbi:hypothetical protein UT300005_14630 [Clostridium sp. CTA-5]
MKKSLKNIVTSILIINAFNIFWPTDYLNLTDTTAYAASKVYLKSISLSDGYDINFSENKYSYILDVDKSLDEIIVRARPEDEDDKVKINGELLKRDDKYRKILNLKEGKNKIEIEVRDDNSANTSLYTLYIYRGGKDTIYLKDINIDSSNIGFEKEKSSYNIEIDHDTSKVLLNAVTEDENYKVSVNGTELDEPNLIKIRFGEIGKYIIKVKVTDIETKRFKEYTLNMYVGIPISPDISNSINSVIKPNQWVIINGRWRYNDSLGECLNDTWFYDRYYDSYFHFNKRGNMQTGWITVDGKWYYLAIHGAMQTGWLLEDGDWYYLDGNGVMQTGWLYNNDKWYYLNEAGMMKKGWIQVDGNWYLLDNSGAMVTGWVIYDGKKYFLNPYGAMEEGWLQYKGYWYYLNSDGSMKSGEWMYNNGKWYYINYIGTMRTGWLSQNNKYYYLNEDGTMSTSITIIDGYTCNFNEDGSLNFN